MEPFLLFKAIISRLLLFGHGITSVYMYAEEQKDAKFWALIVPLVFLFIESCYTCIFRSGREYKYVWPSGFLYITAIIPIIWLIELDLYELQQREIEKEKAVRTVGLTYDNLNEQDQEKINREIVVFAIDSAKHSSQLLKKICELGLMICIIIARWLMPRGELTKDQLSALLLVYVGNSADILELFDTFEEPEVLQNKIVLIVVMCVFTWSMYQFCLVTTATVSDKEENDMMNQPPPYPGTKATSRRTSVISDGSGTFGRNRKLTDARGRKISLNNTNSEGRGRKFSFGGRKASVAPSFTKTDLTNTSMQNEYVDDIRSRTRRISVAQYQERGRGRKTTLGNLEENVVAINEESSEQTELAIIKRKMHGELYQILVTLLMQDGPFLILRLYLIVRLNVTSEMNIFFTCKNAIVSLLLIYRLLILSCHGKDQEESFDREDAATKLHNIQMAMETDEFGPLAQISVK